MKNKYTRKRLIVGVVIVCITIAAGGGLWWLFHTRNSAAPPSDDWQDGVNYRAPTEQERQSGDDKKREIVEEQEQQDQQGQDTGGSAASKKSVSVIVSDAGQYGDVVEVRSFVPSYSQDGTCTLTFTQGANSFTRTTPGYKDISSTICPAVEVKTSDFPNSGQWQIVVSFESADASGVSDARAFTVEK